MEKIRVPVYVTAAGAPDAPARTLLAFRRLRCPKWLRAHREHEWRDFYIPSGSRPEAVFGPLSQGHPQPLGKYPQVRLDIMDVYDHDIS